MKNSISILITSIIEQCVRILENINPYEEREKLNKILLNTEIEQTKRTLIMAEYEKINQNLTTKIEKVLNYLKAALKDNKQ